MNVNKKLRYPVTYLIVRHHSQCHGCDVQRVGNEVNDVPHVPHVLLQADIPQLLYLAPD